jgi:hypothetical protein
MADLHQIALGEGAILRKPPAGQFEVSLCGVIDQYSQPKYQGKTVLYRHTKPRS